MNLVEDSSKLNDELRENRRVILREHQENNRLRAFDSNRFVDSDILTEKDVVGLCSRIKRRKRATAEDLQKLCNAFIQSEANISAFIKVTGAINVIIKEFTGSDRTQQLFAAQCLCNLSLGDEACCSKVATFAGSYLMIFIMKPDDNPFAQICLWITQNIVASGSKALNILMSQELLKNCLHILNVEEHDDVLKLLDLVVDGKWKDLTKEEKRDVQQKVWINVKKTLNDSLSLQVFYKVSTGESAWCLTADETNELITSLVLNLKEEKLDELVVQLSIQILINLFQRDQQNILKFLETLVAQDTKLSTVINSAAMNHKLLNVIKDFMKLLSILFTTQHLDVAQYFALDPIENLKIPKILEF